MELQRELFLWASDMSPAYVTMILYPCTWPLTPTAAWDRWFARSLISTSRWGCVNRKCNIRFLFFFFWMHPTTTLSRKNTARYDLKITECTYFFPPFYIYSACQLACQVKKCWVNQTIKTFRCFHVPPPPLPSPHPDTHKSKPRGCICLSDSGLH